ncbi:hypothetical protein E8E13_003447 [Curvularia kusanoi]|uniref:BTB domain-containing protein n=1 Tax=Curvularia kusanoi TaxID=90978 RepID=A0A9P4W7U6_CURKU|nr:hypothetical protein E8E13_003447 [Curvularia kusanoi]
MQFTDDSTAGHEADEDDHEHRPRQVSAQSSHNDGETWPFQVGATLSSAATARTPHVSLFSPGVPHVPPMSPTNSPDAGTGYVRATPESTPIPAAGPSRPLPSLAAVASMTKRTSRLKLGDDHPPIVQLQTQIPSVQKSGDDPTTPLDTPGKKRTTVDLVGTEYATITSLSGLFAGGYSMSNSRAPSYNQATGPLYLRASNDAVPLPDHLFTRGLLEGRHSDICVIAFGKRYNLHRLLLDRAPFFTTALSEPWIESQSKEVTLHPEEIDHSITQAAFELAIRKIYGVDITKETDAEAIGLFATGCWLEMQDLIDSAIESILRQMAPETLAPLIRLVTNNYYGRSGERILESAKAMLSRNGWEMPLKNWDDMPGDIIRELVGSDGFFVDSEWDRWVLAKRLLDRRLKQVAVETDLMQRGQKPVPKAPQSMRFMALRFDGVYRQNALTATQAFASDAQTQWVTVYTNPDIERLLVLLDEGIHYIHMEYEQLEFIRTARDAFGLPVMPERVISNALWQQLALRQKVLNAEESALELGLCHAPQEPETTDVLAFKEESNDDKGKQKAFTEDEEPEIESESWDGNGKPRKFWIPSTDCNIVLGNGADPVVTTSNTFQRHATRLSATIQPEDAQWATDFASTPSTLANPNTRDHPQRPVSAGGSNAGQPQSLAFSEFPPFRFAAEFPNPRFLKEKKRVYSRTVSYAGSLWNIYIQKVRSAKNIQLGVYLHRAKEREVDESTQESGVSQQTNATVDSRIGQLEREMLMRSERRDRRRSTRITLQDNTGDDDTSGSGGDLDSATVSTPSRNPLFSGRRRSVPTARLSSHGIHALAMPFNTGGLESIPLSSGLGSSYHTTYDSDEEDELDSAYLNPSLNPLARKTRLSMPTLPPYVDGRPTIRTYFKIYSPSKGGRMLSIYESAPDKFNFSQSWGWKSSTLMLDEVIINGDPEGSPPGPATIPLKKGDGKLRFMVVIGNL